MPVRKTHERRWASRGGLKGSDASGWTFLAAGEELTVLGNVLGVRRSRRWRLWHGKADSRRRGRRAARGAEAALAGRTVANPGRVVMFRVRMRCALSGVTGMVVMVAGARHVNEPRLGRADHGSRHRAPDREREREQDQEPNAKRLHGHQVSTGRKVSLVAEPSSPVGASWTFPL